MFEVEDKVTNEHLDYIGEVLFGPFDPVAGGDEAYLVVLQNGPKAGKVDVWNHKHMSLAPKFEEGQVVRASGVLSKVVAGPFIRHTGTKFYVLESPRGDQDIEYEDSISPVVQ